MPSTCLVEVELIKTLENAGLYTIRGKKRVSFLNCFHNSPSWGGADLFFTGG